MLTCSPKLKLEVELVQYSKGTKISSAVQGPDFQKILGQT